jgi:sorbose reductase
MATPTLAAHPNPTAPVLSQFSLKGKTALVTGGTRGIGLEVSRGLAEAGANVAILYTSTSPSTADATAASIASATGVKAKAYKANVINQAEIESVMETVTKDLGDGVLDIVVANAGIATHFPAEEYSAEQWKEIMDVNLNGAFYTAQAAGRIFKRQSEGGERDRAVWCSRGV